MKKTDVKKIAGGTKTTVTGPDGSKTITYDGVNNLHIGHSRTYHVLANPPRAAATTSNQNTWERSSSSNTNFSSTKTGVTFKKVDNFHLNSKQINHMFSSKVHETYTHSKDYRDSEPTSSEKNPSNPSNPSDSSSFKR